MPANGFEPAALVFPLPEELKNSYLKWCRENKNGSGGDKVPVFIPVYPACPGYMPYPVLPSPGQTVPGSPPAVQPVPALSVNPFLLFLILILLVVSFKKDQIVSAIRKLLYGEAEK